jgi:hypothetical protein
MTNLELCAPSIQLCGVRDIDFQHLKAGQNPGDIPVQGRKESPSCLKFHGVLFHRRYLFTQCLDIKFLVHRFNLPLLRVLRADP